MTVVYTAVHIVIDGEIMWHAYSRVLYQVAYDSTDMTHILQQACVILSMM